MQTKRERYQQELTLLPPLETLIPEDHPLRRLNRVLDLRFVHEVVRDRYCQDNGRPSGDPEVVIRLFLIQALVGLVHVRELMREMQVNLAYRWFIGYRLDEQLPDHSTLSKALGRLGDEVFNEVFSRNMSTSAPAKGNITMNFLIILSERRRSAHVRQRLGRHGEEIIWCVDCGQQSTLTNFRGGVVQLDDIRSRPYLDVARSNAFCATPRPWYGFAA